MSLFDDSGLCSHLVAEVSSRVSVPHWVSNWVRTKMEQSVWSQLATRCGCVSSSASVCGFASAKRSQANVGRWPRLVSVPVNQHHAASSIWASGQDAEQPLSAKGSPSLGPRVSQTLESDTGFEPLPVVCGTSGHNSEGRVRIFSTSQEPNPHGYYVSPA